MAEVSAKELAHLREAARLLRLAHALDNDTRTTEVDVGIYARDMAEWLSADEAGFATGIIQ